MTQQNDLFDLSSYHQLPQPTAEAPGKQIRLDLTHSQVTIFDALTQPVSEPEVITTDTETAGAEQDTHCWYCPECQASSDDDGAALIPDDQPRYCMTCAGDTGQDVTLITWKSGENPPLEVIGQSMTAADLGLSKGKPDFPVVIAPGRKSILTVAAAGETGSEPTTKAEAPAKQLTPAQLRLSQVLTGLIEAGWLSDGQTQIQRYRLPVSGSHGMGYAPLNLGGRTRLKSPDGRAKVTLGIRTAYFWFLPGQGRGDKHVQMNTGVEAVLEEAKAYYTDRFSQFTPGDLCTALPGSPHEGEQVRVSHTVPLNQTIFAQVTGESTTRFILYRPEQLEKQSGEVSEDE